MTSIALRPAAVPLANSARAEILSDPGFGRFFTDNMVSAVWSEADGWHKAQLEPYRQLSLDPSSMVLHYGQAIFEGLKAYRQVDGEVTLFRPDANARRFARSAERLAMPPLSEDFFISACEALIRQERQWVPTGIGTSLYLRPLMIATEVGLGVRPSAEYLFLLLASPAGNYFSGDVRPVSVWLSQEYVRAAPGGTGEAKCAGNYAASLVAQAEAVGQGCDQVVWLDAAERRWVEEMGGMNLFFVYADGRIVTPELTGALLPGITRDALLTLARDLGHSAEEGRIDVEGWRKGNASGDITEVFACGTAAVITPVGTVKYRGGSWPVGDGMPGRVSMALREKLLAIQHGQVPDRHGWIHRVIP
jgi:branched-chain amino acid aminotransferase